METSTLVFTGEGFELPRDGVALAVVGDGATVGWFRLVPAAGSRSPSSPGKVAVALSQLLGSRAGPTRTGCRP